MQSLRARLYIVSPSAVRSHSHRAAAVDKLSRHRVQHPTARSRFRVTAEGGRGQRFRLPKLNEIADPREGIRYALAVAEHELKAFDWAAPLLPSIRFAREAPEVALFLAVGGAIGISAIVVSLLVPTVLVGVSLITWTIIPLVFLLSTGLMAIGMGGVVFGTSALFLFLSAGSSLGVVSIALAPALAACFAVTAVFLLMAEVVKSSSKGAADKAVAEASSAPAAAAVDTERLDEQLLRDFDARLLGTPAEWGVAEVGAWLRAEGFAGFEEQFSAERVDGRVLLSLREEDLRELGALKMGDRKRLLGLIQAMRRKHEENDSFVRDDNSTSA